MSQNTKRIEAAALEMLVHGTDAALAVISTRYSADQLIAAAEVAAAVRFTGFTVGYVLADRARRAARR